MKMKLPHLQLTIEMPYVFIRTSVFCNSYAGQTYNCIHMIVELWKWKWTWKTEFALHSSDRRR
jgi:hypothetical protein